MWDEAVEDADRAVGGVNDAAETGEVDDERHHLHLPVRPNYNVMQYAWSEQKNPVIGDEGAKRYRPNYYMNWDDSGRNLQDTGALAVYFVSISVMLEFLFPQPFPLAS